MSFVSAMRGIVAVWVVAAAGLGLSGCGGGGGGGPSATLTGVEVTPAKLSLANGTSGQLTATALFSDGSKKDVSGTATWTSGDSGIATVTQGTVVAVGLGSTSVTASYGDFSAAATVTVTSAVVTGVQVDPPKASIANGTSAQFTATAVFSDNTTQDVTASASWSTADASVATVGNATGSYGKAAGAAPGSTTVSAFFQGYTGSATLTVTAATLSQLTISPLSRTLPAGLSGQFIATAVFSDNTTQDVTDAASWGSSDTGVATVSDSGLATAVVAGSATITASYGGLNAQASFTVTAASMVSLQVTPAAPTIARGTNQQFTATAVYSDQSTQDLTAAVVWSSSTPSVATVSNADGSNGLATALNVGTTTISAIYQSFSASATLTVSGATVASISIVPQALSLPNGFSVQYKAAAVYTDNTVQDVTGGALWVSSDSSVASVSNADGSQGMATALGAGQTSISATFGGKIGTATLTVTSAVVTGVQVTPPSATIAKGTTQQFTATAIFSDQSTEDVTAAATWLSSDNSVATVSNVSGSYGLARGIAPGSASITAVFKGFSAQSALTVSSATIVGLTVVPQSLSLPSGLSAQYRAAAVFSDNSVQDVTALATWLSSNSGVASISNADGSQGKLLAAAPGSATISASYGGFAGQSVLTVTSAVLMSLQVTPQQPTLAAGYSRALTATGIYSDNSKADISTQVSWTSSSPAIAIVSDSPGSNGEVTGVALGNATIFASLQGVQGSTLLTVSGASLSSIDVQPVGPGIVVGTAQAFSATGLFSDHTTLDLSTAVSWTSSNTAVATIDAGGLAQSPSGGAAGTVGITAVLNGKVGASTLKVRAATLQSIAVALTPAAASLPVGYTQRLSATGSYSDGTSQDISALVSWTSADTSVATVATVGSVGVASGVGAGSTTIGAQFDGVGGSTPLQVSLASLQSLSLTPANPTLPVGVRQTLLASGQFSDGSSRDLTAVATWASTDASTAFVANDSGLSGVLSGVKAGGGATISARYAGVSGSTAATISGATLAAIAVTPAIGSLVVGQTQSMQATGSYSDGSQYDLSSQLSWLSSLAATVDISNASSSLGVATGKSPGTATVTAYSPATGVSGSASVTVTRAAGP